MVFDKIENLGLYARMGERMEKAVNFILSTDFSSIKPGRYPVAGDEVFALVNEYNTKAMDDAKWEAHLKYADIQYVISGKELMGFAMADSMECMEPYNEAKDIAFYKGEGNYVSVSEGELTIFFPHDAHRPSIAINGSSFVKKVVVKVLV